jgi:copper chaperone
MTTSAAERTYAVPGISCDHCRHAIETELAKVAGVGAFRVSVADRTVTVSGGDDTAVRAAIEEAGYDVAS